MSLWLLIKYQIVNVEIERISCSGNFHGRFSVALCARVDLKLTFMNQSIDTLIHSNGDH